MTELSGALAYLEELYPDSIGEACLIDRGGAEVARVVRGSRAPVADARQVNDTQGTIAAAVDQQTAVTATISRSLTEAAAKSARIAAHTADMAATAESTLEGADATRQAAADLHRMADELRHLLGAFT